MAKYRILLVDDQHEIRRMLRAGIETLGKDYQVVDLPSAEEAMLVLGTQPFHLLICDMRLPGMTGLDLKARVQRRSPDLKVVMITGLTDTKTHKQIEESKPDASFVKPLQLTDLLGTIQRLMTGKEPERPAEPAAAAPEARPPTLAERLANLRYSLKAEAVVLLDDRAQMIAEAGSIPEISPDSPLMPSLLAALSASGKVNQGLGIRTPEDILIFRGGRFTLALAHVGPAFALVIVTPPSVDLFSHMNSLVFPAVNNLIKIIGSLGEPSALAEAALPSAAALPEPLAEISGDIAKAEALRAETQAAPAPVEEEPPVQISAEELQEFETLFGKAAGQTAAVSNLDDFWSAATEGTDPNDVGNASAISYEQARQLGLAPEEKKE